MTAFIELGIYDVNSNFVPDEGKKPKKISSRATRSSLVDSGFIDKCEFLNLDFIEPQVREVLLRANLNSCGLAARFDNGKIDAVILQTVFHGKAIIASRDSSSFAVPTGRAMRITHKLG